MQSVARYFFTISLFYFGVTGALAKTASSKQKVLSARLVPADKPKFDEAAVESVFTKYLARISRPIVAFHYENEQASMARKFDLSTGEKNLEYVKEQIDQFLKSNGKYGFYLATDPVASREYGDQGGENFRLIQVVLPINLVYLDIRSEGAQEALFNDLMGVVNDFDCANKLRIAATAFLEEDECSVLKRKIFARLKIQAIRYQWYAASRLENLCRGKDHSAFIATGSDWLQAKDLKVFTRASRSDPELRETIQAIVLNAGKMYPYDQQPLWTDISGSLKITAPIGAWMNEFLLNCQDALLPNTGELQSPEKEKAETSAD